MTDKKRSRGRPKGSGYDDWPILLQIAKIIFEHPEMPRTTAMREVGYSTTSDHKRLMRKWMEKKQWRKFEKRMSGPKKLVKIQHLNLEREE